MAKHVYNNTKENNLTSKISCSMNTTHLLFKKSFRDMEKGSVNNLTTTACTFT